MQPFIIGIALLGYSNLYSFTLRILHLKPSSVNALTFNLIGFLVAGTLIYPNYSNATQADMLVNIACFVGASVRIWHYLVVGQYKRKSLD
jgi:hypothetical protein